MDGWKDGSVEGRAFVLFSVNKTQFNIAHVSTFLMLCTSGPGDTGTGPKSLLQSTYDAYHTYITSWQKTLISLLRFTCCPVICEEARHTTRR